MTANHLNEIYASRVNEDNPNISYGSLIRWRVKTIRAGNIQIIKTYPARADYTQPRKARNKQSREVQKKLNDRNRSEQFRLLLLTNFSKDDLFATLTFEQEPEDKIKALEKLKYFLKKLRKASTGEIKYLGVIETQAADGDAVRCHIHIVISGQDHAAIKKNWIYGNAMIQKIEDVMDAAGYLSKTFAEMPAGEHHYVRSRNLRNPDIETKTLDVRYLPDAEELEAIVKCPREYAAVFFPDYELIEELEIWQSSYIPGCYVKLEMIHRDDLDKKAAGINSFHTHQANEMLGFHKSSAPRRAKHPADSG
ncbi:MAG: hypothetical protein IJI45_16955 [Anaerolineaceae bacterium]|nr:hypothetical protein [Anaerolineaceae bacterium]MBQ6502284.1 hypothetical protein [Flexilinea sp.]